MCLCLAAFAQQQVDAAERSKMRQRAKAYWKRADARRKRKKYEDARKDYDKALIAWRAVNARNFANVTPLMIELCEKMPDLNVRKLKNGVYRGTARGYSADITVAVKLRKGRIVNFAIADQKESRPLKSLKILPTLIRRKQSPSVDAVSGATITSYAVMSATLRALEKAKPDNDED